MRNLVVLQFVSLDGVTQAPGHAGEDTDGGFVHGGWTESLMPEHRRHGTARYHEAGAFLFGRHTYEIWTEYWPTVTDPDDHIAAALNSRPKYVVSTTLGEPTWAGTTVIRDDVPAEVARLKKQPGGDILVPGSGRLTHTLAAEGLIDRYELWIHPVALGTGKRLFVERMDLALVNAMTTTSGLVILTYQPANR